ncbi:ribonuclease III domain-containing protein [Massariosphaeria phaeospora]|uniref:Ribonuclease III domain-containing protein n=1 Tax=Massariosphaeria phaeospora TaxID=100035 RepID=A0A7C8MD81_9PLEO|nr:ribonuclease III domain-containing protein [Massariosphaeria phaeospora]
MQKRGGSFPHYGGGPHISRMPDPANCEPCQLAGAEMDSGIISLLDKLVAEETDPQGDRNILHHAEVLRKLLSSRADISFPSKAKLELDKKRPERQGQVTIPAYIDTKLRMAQKLPPLPPIAEPYLEEAVFTHRSANNDARVRGLNSDSLNYERLEFLGDAYIELIASRVIYSRFPHTEPSQQSFLREQLVRNDTLAHFSTSYSLGDRVQHGGHLKESKAWAKVIADVFEAYVAALVLSDLENGFTTAEHWLTELWASQLLNHKEKIIENVKAKDDVQKKLLLKGVKLDYREEKEMVYENTVQKYFIALYLTGWGYESEWLGSGEGQNKAQASLLAAADALERRNDVFRVAEKKKIEMTELRKREVLQAAELAGHRKEETTVEGGKGDVVDIGEKTRSKRDRDTDVETALADKRRKKHKQEKKHHLGGDNHEKSA